MLDRLFVYGTLRRGQPAHALLEPSIRRAVSGWIAGSIYALADGYPGHVSSAHGRVHGELVWLDDEAPALVRLDAYEGDEFIRTRQLVTTVAGDELDAWIYTLADPRSVGGAQPIAHGDWVRYLADAALR